MKRCTAIFDIGKTNKKFILFDKNYKEVYSEQVQFEEIRDEDGDACDDLPEIENWIKLTIQKALNNPDYQIERLNFSTYGASLVHLDKNGKVLTPLYNYLKPFPKGLLKQFYDTYGDELTLAGETASPPLEMLNAGLQLYFLKYAKPEIFEQIQYSLHFPQYLSYLFSQKPLSEYTSIGCHTMLWDYGKKDYHSWVYAEGFDKLLPPIVDTGSKFQHDISGKNLTIGLGIHDSSAALLPYVKAESKPFLLLSTGTWSIALNPFSEEVLTAEDLQNDCLNYMRTNGNPVKASRLFLGNEYQNQVKKLNAFFKKDEDYHFNLKFDAQLATSLKQNFQNHFKFESLPIEQTNLVETDFNSFPNYKTAYHQLMLELVGLQTQSIKRAIGTSQISKIYIDGGFANNDFFVKLLVQHFTEYQILIANKPLGSALGAAMAVSDEQLNEDFLARFL